MEQAKRDCILAAATKAFTRLGFKKTSIDDIAKHAGVAKGTVYLACENKEDLFYQAIHRDIRQWIGETSKLIDPRRPADELLAMVAQNSVTHLEGHPLVRELYEGKHTDTLPGWTAQLEELRALGRQNVIEILKLGISQKRFRPELDVEEVAKILQDLQMATFVLHRPSDIDFPRRVRAALDLVLHGLAVRPPAHPHALPA